jgi:hypothetical protein
MRLRRLAPSIGDYFAALRKDRIAAELRLLFSVEEGLDVGFLLALVGGAADIMPHEVEGIAEDADGHHDLGDFTDDGMKAGHQ